LDVTIFVKKNFSQRAQRRQDIKRVWSL